MVVVKELIQELVKEELILVDLKAEDSNDAIGKLAEVLYKMNFVKESYKKGVQDREKIFPTGLPTEGVGVAIPHTDIEHVNTPAIAIGVLENPITFNMMGMMDEEVDVQIIFMLAIKEPKAQIELLENLMGIFQNKSILEKIVRCNTSREVKEIFLKAI